MTILFYGNKPRYQVCGIPAIDVVVDVVTFNNKFRSTRISLVKARCFIKPSVTFSIPRNSTTSHVQIYVTLIPFLHTPWVVQYMLNDVLRNPGNTQMGISFIFAALTSCFQLKRYFPKVSMRSTLGLNFPCVSD